MLLTGIIFFACDSEEKGNESLLFLLLAKSSPKIITEFRFASPEALGLINEEKQTVLVTVPYGTDITALVPIITYAGMSINPGSGVKQDFSNPVVYTVTAEDASTREYIVYVDIAPNSAKAITGFSFVSPPATGVINETNHTINITVPFGTNVAYLVPTVTHTGASIYPSSGIAQNYTNLVSYTVTAEDNTTRDYTVTVTVALNSSKAITGFKFILTNPTIPEVSGIIDETSHSITVIVPHETTFTSLVPTITYTGASISPGSGVAQNFTNPVTYTVTAADSSTQLYTVTVRDTARLTYNEGIGNTGGLVPVGSTVYNAWSQVDVYDNRYNLVGPIIRDGIKQRFTNWNTKPDGSGIGYSPGGYFILREDTTLYAIYTEGTNVLRKVGPALGWVFYDAGVYTKWGRYLEAGNYDLPDSVWGTNFLDSFAYGTAVGSGDDNTEAIIANDPATDKAANRCAIFDIGVNGINYDDWYLPSKNELNYMFTNLFEWGVANFKGDIYWSSSEYDNEYAESAWYQYFNLNEPSTVPEYNRLSGYQGRTWKSSVFCVRPIRAFGFGLTPIPISK